jgi:Ssp1 endopeptidase immunity protein Rap1a
MHPVLLGLLAAALLAGNAGAQGGYDSASGIANDVVPACKEFLAREGETTLETSWGRGFCFGTFASLDYMNQFLPPHLRSCPPKGVTRRQAVRVVLAYIERRPQRLHEAFLTLAIEAFREAWPCNWCPFVSGPKPDRQPAATPQSGADPRAITITPHLALDAGATGWTMTTLTMRIVRGDFVVTGPDIEPMKFKTRREAKDWCMAHYPGSPIAEIRKGRKRAPPKRNVENKPR